MLFLFYWKFEIGYLYQVVALFRNFEILSFKRSCMKAKQKDIYKIQAQICQALANEKRLEIIHRLGESGKCYAADLMASVGLSKTNLSQHMRVLRDAEIVVVEREGTQAAYRLTSPKVSEACEILHGFLVERQTRRAEIGGTEK